MSKHQEYQKALDNMCCGCYGGDDGCNGKDKYCSRYLRLQELVDAWEVINNTFEIGVDEQIDEIYIKGKNYYGNDKTVWGHSKEGTSKVKQALEVKDE